MGITRLILAVVASGCCYLSGQQLLNRVEGSLLLPEDPMIEARRLAQEGRWAESKMLADFVVENPTLGDHAEAFVLAQQADQELNSFWGQAQRFAEGAVTGEPTDPASMLGSLTLDLFVIGDIRDLAVQGWNEYSDGSGDSLILALSAIGLTTTLAPYVDWAPALLKTLKRTGDLSRNFLASLTRIGKEAMKTRKFTVFGTVLTDLGTAARRLGPGPLRGVMGSIESAGDLTKIAKASEFDAKGTYALARLFGKDGVKWISKDGKNVGVLVGSIKVGSRVTKIVHKATGALSTLWLGALFAVAVFILIGALVPRGRRGRSV